MATDWPSVSIPLFLISTWNSTSCLPGLPACPNSLITYLLSNPTLSPPGRDLTPNSHCLDNTISIPSLVAIKPPTYLLTRLISPRSLISLVTWIWRAYSHFKNYDKARCMLLILNVFLHRDNVLSSPQVLWYCCC